MCSEIMKEREYPLDTGYMVNPAHVLSAFIEYTMISLHLQTSKGIQIPARDMIYLCVCVCVCLSLKNTEILYELT